MNVLIAEDHIITARLLKVMLSKQKAFKTVQVANNGKDAMKIIENDKVDVLLLDLELPYLSGFEIMDKIRSISNDTKVLVLSGHEEQKYKDRSLGLGASGFLTKNVAMKNIVSGINAVYNGESIVS